MQIEVEVYLRDQIIHGELTANGPRPFDQINGEFETFLILQNVCWASLHVASQPSRIGTVRVEKEHVLLVVPHDSGLMIPGPIRGGWVEKRSVRATIGLGPLVVTGDLHVRQHEQIAIETLGRERGGRYFLPVTNAQISSAYHPDWVLETQTAFLARAAISHLGWQAQPTAQQPQLQDARRSDALYRRRPTGPR